MSDQSRYSVTMRRLPVFAALTLMALLPSAAGAATANYRGASQDGSAVFFSTVEPLVPGDTDAKQDVYKRAYDAGFGDYVTREASIGPIGGNDAYEAFFEKSSADGERVFFSTAERLTAADTDIQRDVYVRDFGAGTTELVSAGSSSCAPGCGNGGQNVGFSGATPDGSSAFFVTAESLAAGDTDSAIDIYERKLATETTSLVSAGASACSPACGNGPRDATLWAVSASGSHAYFTTAEQLTGADTDTAEDLYARDLTTDTTVLVSAGNSTCVPGCGNGGAVPVFRGASDGGSKVFFTIDESLAPGDSDTATDVYVRDLQAGTTSLISAGVDPNVTANFAAASIDGSTVFFTTTEGLVGADTNGANDVYRWSGGAAELVTSGTCPLGGGCGSTFYASSPAADRLLFTTTEKLAAADTDNDADLYEATAPGWSPVLVSVGEAGCLPACGNGAAPAIVNAVAPDMSKVFFTTIEPLSSLDTDLGADIYLRDVGAGSTTLSSPAGVCPHKDPCNSIFSGASTDGAHVFFQTDERLTAEDIDSDSDVYERSGGETRIVSVGNSAPIGPATPVLTGTDPASPGESTTPKIRGQADPGSSVKIYTQAGCTGSPIATGTSLDLGGIGIQVAVAAGSTTSFYATATDTGGDTSGCSSAVTYTQSNPEPPPPPPTDPPPPPTSPPPNEGSGGSTGGSGGKSGGSGSKANGGGGNSKVVAYVSPQTLITFGPGSKTRKRRPVFRFTDATEQPGTSFYCKVDGRSWRSCASPQKLSSLALGKHVFKVKARNAMGEWGPSPVKRAFKVVG